MMKCECCNKEKRSVKKYILPMIGYGSKFDCLSEDDRLSFELCEDCKSKIDEYLITQNIQIDSFWEFNIITNDYYEKFEYEDVLDDVLHTFLPETLKRMGLE